MRQASVHGSLPSLTRLSKARQHAVALCQAVMQQVQGLHDEQHRES
jgi:hypothetical protein